jgi:hypothetical protein
MPLKYTWANGEQFTAGDANDVAIAVNASYTKPGTGIPASDLASAVQTSLGKADSAVQSVASTNITDATTTGKAILTTTDASTARTTLGVSYGTSAGTVAQGNDSRFSPASTAILDSTATGRALLTTTDASTARTTLGVAYGATGGTVAQGNDSRITGAQQTSEKGNANGYASLDSGGKVPIGQLPSSIMEYQGVWNASTNTPTLADGTGSPGDVYRVSVAGSRNLGSGSISFAVGDYCVMNSSNVWEKSDTTDAVSTVAGRTGDVTLTASDVGLGNVDNTSNSTERAATATLTNKRITPRIGTTASSATPAIDVGLYEQFNITALAAAITSMTSGLSGTPTDGQKLLIRIKDNGTARAITWGASYVSSGVATLPTTTVISKTHLIGLIYDSAASKWVCVASDATGY